MGDCSYCHDINGRVYVKYYDSIQKNRERELTDELNADGHPLKTNGKPDRKIVGGCHRKLKEFKGDYSLQQLITFLKIFVNLSRGGAVSFNSISFSPIKLIFPSSSGTSPISTTFRLMAQKRE